MIYTLLEGQKKSGEGAVEICEHHEEDVFHGVEAAALHLQECHTGNPGPPQKADDGKVHACLAMY